MTFSNIFDRIGSRLIGLKLVGSSISPDLLLPSKGCHIVYLLWVPRGKWGMRPLRRNARGEGVQNYKENKSQLIYK